MTYKELSEHPWITESNKLVCDWANDVEYFVFNDVTENEIEGAMTALGQIKNVYFKKKTN